MRLARRLGGGLLLVAIGVLLVFAFTYQSVLAAVGGYLVESELPVKADAIIVLAGDYRGSRVKKGGELVAAGFAPIALVSGPMEMYGVNEATLAIDYAVRNGADWQSFTPFFSHALSTLEEAWAFAPELRKRNIHKVLLVTSGYHTKRAARTFRSVLGNDIAIHPVAAPDKYFEPDTWWRTREGQKTLFYEYSKTIAARLGL